MSSFRNYDKCPFCRRKMLVLVPKTGKNAGVLVFPNHGVTSQGDPDRCEGSRAPVDRAGRETFAEASTSAKDRTLEPTRPAPSADFESRVEEAE